MKKRARDPFHFYDCIRIIRPVGKSAHNLREFLGILRDLDVSCIYKHLHQSFITHQFELWDYPNDFARWAAAGLGDLPLAEKFANFDPYEEQDMERIKAALIDLIEDHLWSCPSIPWARPGMEFFFEESQTLLIETELVAHDLKEFLDALHHIPIPSIYYHCYEAALRLGKGNDDFSNWLQKELQCDFSEKKIKNLDFYLFSLEELRQALIEIITEECDASRIL